MSRIIIQDGGIKGSNRMKIMNDSGNNQNARRLKLMIGSNQKIIVSVAGKTYESEDLGITYTELPATFPTITAYNLNISTNNIFYAVTNASIYNDSGTIRGTVYLALSEDSGNTWTRDVSLPFTPGSTSPGSFMWGSQDGKYLMASSCTYYIDGTVITSRNFGQDVSVNLSGASMRYTAGYVDKSGKNMIIGGTGSGTGIMQTKYSSDYGITWNNFTQIPSGSPMGGAVVSGDGSRIVVWEQYHSSGNAVVYVSTDWITWNSTTVSQRMPAVGAISYDGKYILIPSSDRSNAPQPYLNLSTNYGSTWTLKDVGYSQFWGGCAMSADGKYMIAYGGGGSSGEGYVVGYCYKSINYGATWSRITELPASMYYDVAMSKSGKYVFVTDSSASHGGGVYRSDDYMNSWTHHFDGSTAAGIFINF